MFKKRTRLKIEPKTCLHEEMKTFALFSKAHIHISWVIVEKSLRVTHLHKEFFCGTLHHPRVKVNFKLWLLCNWYYVIAYLHYKLVSILETYTHSAKCCPLEWSPFYLCCSPSQVWCQGNISWSRPMTRLETVNIKNSSSN